MAAEQQPRRKRRPAKQRARRRQMLPDAGEIGALLSAPVMVKSQGGARKMSPFEASLRGQVRQALVERDLKALDYVLKLCRQHGLLEAPPPPPLTGGLLIIPRSWEQSEWMAMFHRFGPPPWPGKRSGLPGEEES
jgi:hypothetical protein